MAKYKVGDRLVCVKGEIFHETNHPGGHGWKKGRVIRVYSVTQLFSPAIPVYWPVRGSGVYEDWLEPAPPAVPPEVTKIFNKLRKAVENEVNTLE